MGLIDFTIPITHGGNKVDTMRVFALRSGNGYCIYERRGRIWYTELAYTTGNAVEALDIITEMYTTD